MRAVGGSASRAASIQSAGVILWSTCRQTPGWIRTNLLPWSMLLLIPQASARARVNGPVISSRGTLFMPLE